MKKNTYKNPNGIGSIEPRGKKGIYTARWMVNGEIFKRSTHTADRDEALRLLEEWTAPFLLKSDAETAQALAIRAKVKANLAKAIPLSTMFDEWKASPRRKREWSEATERNYTIRVSAFVRWMATNHPEGKTMADVSEEIADEYMKSVAPSVTAAGYNGVLGIMTSLWNCLQGKGSGAINPWVDIRRQKTSPSQRQPFTVDDLRLLFDNAPDEEWRTLFFLALYTGQRLGDLCSMKWELINFEEGIFNPFKQHKTGSMIYRFPLHPALVEQLSKTPEEKRKGFILPNLQRKHKKSHSKISEQFNNLCRRLGIYVPQKTQNGTRNLKTFHCFRHTVVSNSANAGISLDVTSKISGRLTKQNAERYFHDDDAAKQSVVFAQPDFSTNSEETMRKFRMMRLKKIIEGWTQDDLKEALAIINGQIK